MAVITGKSAAINGKPCVQQFTLATESDAPRFVCSGGSGGTGRMTGNVDWSGQYRALGGVPAVLPGATFQFEGSLDGVNGANTAADGAIVEQVQIEWDIENGGPLMHTVNFASNGELSRAADTSADATVPTPVPSVGTKASLGTVVASPVFTDIADIRSMTLTITASNVAYNSSTASGFTKRAPGNIDFNAVIRVFTDDLATLPDVNAVRQLRMYVNATEFWDLKWAQVMSLGDMEGDVEGPGLVSPTINLAMNAFQDVGGTQTKGTIIEPDLTVFWP